MDKGEEDTETVVKEVDGELRAENWDTDKRIRTLLG